MKTTIVIPARYKSSRFPGKPLVSVAGVPMIVRVWQQASKARCADTVLVATDDQRIADVIRTAGGKAVMTDEALPSGTDRVYAALTDDSAEIVINLQGDEPLINPDYIDLAIKALEDTPCAQVATLATPINTIEELNNPNAVKVLLDQNMMAIYFSRVPIPNPFRTVPKETTRYLRHVGLYAYRRQFLNTFMSTGPAWSERVECLEQLRVLELGEKIAVRVVDQVFPGIDTPEDLRILEEILRKQEFVSFNQE